MWGLRSEQTLNTMHWSSAAKAFYLFLITEETKSATGLFTWVYFFIAQNFTRSRVNRTRKLTQIWSWYRWDDFSCDNDMPLGWLLLKLSLSESVVIHTIEHVAVTTVTLDFVVTWLHCNKNPIYVFPKKDLRGLSPNFHIHVSVCDLYIPTIDSTYFPAAE